MKDLKVLFFALLSSSAFAEAPKIPEKLATMTCEGNLSVLQNRGSPHSRELNLERKGFSVTVDLTKNPNTPENINQAPWFSIMAVDHLRGPVRGSRSPFWAYEIYPAHKVGADGYALPDQIEFKVTVAYGGYGTSHQIALPPGGPYRFSAPDETLKGPASGELNCMFSVSQ